MLATVQVTDPNPEDAARSGMAYRNRREPNLYPAGAKTCSTSRDQVIFVDQATDLSVFWGCGTGRDRQARVAASAAQRSPATGAVGADCGVGPIRGSPWLAGGPGP